MDKLTVIKGTKLSDIERKRRLHILEALAAQMRKKTEQWHLETAPRLKWQHVDCTERREELIMRGKKPREEVA